MPFTDAILECEDEGQVRRVVDRLEAEIDAAVHEWDLRYPVGKP